jgi:hypothetical protein
MGALRFGWIPLCGAALVAAASGCGGSIAGGDLYEDAAAGDAARDAKGDAVADARDASKADTADAAKDVYVDPICPDASPPPTKYNCDPLASSSTCPAGEGCMPWVEYPTVACEYEVYGASCTPAGSGTQGTPCDGGCASGFVCVVSGAGNVCTRMCKAGAPGACPDGLVCAPTDVPGIGSCL